MKEVAGSDQCYLYVDAVRTLFDLDTATARRRRPSERRRPPARRRRLPRRHAAAAADAADPAAGGAHRPPPARHGHGGRVSGRAAHRLPRQHAGARPERVGARRAARGATRACASRSRSSRPRATSSSTRRSPRSATRGCSPRSSRRPCSTAAPTSPCTRPRTCPRRSPRAWPSSPSRAREDVRDVFVPPVAGRRSRSGAGPLTLDDLPQGARVGTSSLRRRSQLLALRPDLELVDIRGNVQTRLRKLEEQGMAGTILAAAGLARLGSPRLAAFAFAFDQMLPGRRPGLAGHRGAGRRRARRRGWWPRSTTGRPRWPCAPSAPHRTLEGGCQVPIAAHAELDAGGEARRGDRSCCAPSSARWTARDAVRGELARPRRRPRGARDALADELLDARRRPTSWPRSARREPGRSGDGAPRGPAPRRTHGGRDAAARAGGLAGGAARGARRRGAAGADHPHRAAAARRRRRGRRARALRRTSSWSSRAPTPCTSSRLPGARHGGRRHARPAPVVAAVGPATAAALEQHGVACDLVPDEYVAEGARGLAGGTDAAAPGARVLIPCAATRATCSPRRCASGAPWSTCCTSTTPSPPASSPCRRRGSRRRLHHLHVRQHRAAARGAAGRGGRERRRRRPAARRAARRRPALLHRPRHERDAARARAAGGRRGPEYTAAGLVAAIAADARRAPST